FEVVAVSLRGVENWAWLEGLVSDARRFDAKRDLVGDADTVAFQGDNFFGVIGEDANVFESEIDQNLRADAAFVLNHALACGFAIELAAGVKMNLRQGTGEFWRFDSKTAAGVMEIEKNAAIFFGDRAQRARDKLGTIAGDGTED